ncbi:unnamed protein product [Bursaphelenchus okinawaensis]|uniref:Abnormal cell migration protein 18-like fibronectin type I domain-containing protein n=1 Tax=Bursaphelenchus okinawaensis TaxID=465554 RepID=A0A811L3C6_9BILA|nr:unnamed protein product [Bursaphelenchus okinawaensis]CAG9115597.1 unnamed protein product [Bursaphelenchus okinawaensis]
MERTLLLVCLTISLCYGCEYNNVTRKHNEEWVENSYFVFRCEIFNKNTSWRVKIQGCDFNGTRFALNERKNGQACQSLDDGRVKFALGPICDGRNEGETWDDGHFRKTCIDDQTKFIGCTTSEKVYIPIGEEKQSGTFKWKCESAPNNGVKLYPTNVDEVNAALKNKSKSTVVEKKGNGTEVQNEDNGVSNGNEVKKEDSGTTGTEVHEEGNSKMKGEEMTLDKKNDDLTMDIKEDELQKVSENLTTSSDDLEGSGAETSTDSL